MPGLPWPWTPRKLLVFCKTLELRLKLKIADKGPPRTVLTGGLIGRCMPPTAPDDAGIFGAVWEWTIELPKFNRCRTFGILFLEDICELPSLG